MTEGPFEMRHEEGGYVEFLNEDVPTVVREIDGRVAILTTLEQPRKVVGYRVYDPGSSPSEVFGSASPAGVGVETPPPSQHVVVTDQMIRAGLEAAPGVRLEHIERILAAALATTEGK